MSPRFRSIALGLAFVSAALAAAADSFYPLRPEDPRAVYLERPTFSVVGDGVADDTAALQQAIDRVQETVGKGVLFIPEGRYRISRTLQVWAGIRLIGFGARRPVFVLGASTPGFEDGPGKYLVHFVSDRPEAGQPIRDANPGTFYSALSNVDLEIGPGNPAAVGVRAHFAQHCYLAHIEFRIGDGRAGIEEVGNEAEDLRFIGGEFGITMHKPSPSWPFALIDATFEGQRRAAIETEEGGLTLVRPQFRRVPTAVLVRPGRAEELWMVDARLEDITGPALVISEEASARTMINVENAVCARVPVFAAFRESGRQVAGSGALYRVAQFSHGLQFADQASEPALRTLHELAALAEMPPPVPTDIASLPPMAEWVNVRDCGAVGDGVADDTAALRAAIAQHRTLYFPAGRFRVSDTLTLRADSVLVAFSPTATQLLLADDTPAFGPDAGALPAVAATAAERAAYPAGVAGGGAPKALLEAPAEGTNIVTGLGLDTGGRNPRAVALKWMAGERSLVNDVRFVGGHGTYRADGSPVPIYNNNRTADADPRRRWDSQYWSLWITAGGGGTFKGIWTPSPFAAAGVYISDTETPGRIYALSSEHHVRNEVKLRRVANWRIYALQMEEERGESPHALPLEIIDSHDITFANLYLYRVDTEVPFPCGVAVEGSRAIDLRGVHAYSPGKLTFDNTVRDRTHRVDVRAREIAWLKIADPVVPRAPAPALPFVAPGAPLERVGEGFNNADGLVVDHAGDAYFLDARWQRIFRWSPAARRLSLVSDAPLHPVALAVAADGRLLVVARGGSVYALPVETAEAETTALVPVPAAERPGATAWLPVSRWRDGHDWLEVNARREPLHYVSGDGSAFIPAPEAFAQLGQPGIPWWRRGTVDLVRSHALAPANVGRPFYMADEFGQKTWRFEVCADGTLAAPVLFAEEGEAGVAVDDAGRVYVCAGQIFVYAPSGRRLGTIEVPERPTSVALAGADRRTLLITARSSLYALRLR